MTLSAFMLHRQSSSTCKGGVPGWIVLRHEMVPGAEAHGLHQGWPADMSLGWVRRSPAGRAL